MDISVNDLVRMTYRMVSSNCAELRPSRVTAVQSSFQWSRLAVPRLIMGSFNSQSEFHHSRTHYGEDLSRLHTPWRLASPVVDDIGLAMELDVSSFCDKASLTKLWIPCPVYRRTMLKPFGLTISSILLPISRYGTPGLQMAIDSSIAFFVVAMSSADSAVTLPTGYVALTSPWKPP